MTSFDILTNLVNVGYLFGAMMVAASVLIRRYLPRGPQATPASRAAVLVRFWLVVAFSIGGHAEILWLYTLLAHFSHNRSSLLYRLPVLRMADSALLRLWLVVGFSIGGHVGPLQITAFVSVRQTCPCCEVAETIYMTVR